MADTHEALLRELIDSASSVIIGKRGAIRLALACLLARGHLLIEDVPGVGKTTLAHVLAKLLGLDYQRIQFTSDLLPSDILGVSIYERETGEFRFHPGPVFAQLILADEINRATPKAQGALLEAMEEGQVTIEGHTWPLPTPFFVIATQNPVDQLGTHALPESQLDRFLMRIRIGYPDPRSERAILAGRDPRERIADLRAMLDAGQLRALHQRVPEVHVSEALLDYVQAIVRFTRERAGRGSGLSPRAAMGLLQAARAWALIDGRDQVLPEDVQAVLDGVVAHRLHGHDGGDVSRRILEAVAVDQP